MITPLEERIKIRQKRKITNHDEKIGQENGSNPAAALVIYEIKVAPMEDEGCSCGVKSEDNGGSPVEIA